MRAILFAVLFAWLLSSIPVRSASDDVPLADVRAYVHEMEKRHAVEIEKRDAYIRQLEGVAQKARNWNMNCKET